MKKLITFLLFSFPVVVQAQTDSLISYWDITTHLGVPVSGFPKHLEEMMESRGFGQNSVGLFGGIDYPFSSKTPLFQLAVERVSGKIWSGKFLLSTTKGEVFGNSNIHGSITYTYNLTTAAFLIGVYSKRRISRFAVGPSLSFTNVNRKMLLFLVSQTSHTETETIAGFILEAGLRFPARRSRFFMDINSQYQFTGKSDLDSFNTTNADVIGQIQTIFFDPGKKSFSNLSFNFGLGVRLW